MEIAAAVAIGFLAGVVLASFLGASARREAEASVAFYRAIALKLDALVSDVEREGHHLSAGLQKRVEDVARAIHGANKAE